MIRSVIFHFALLHLLGASSFATQRGIINDPDGSTNVRAAQGADAAVVAKVRTGEAFDFESAEDSEWWRVTLSSGKTGWMHKSRIRFHFTIDEIPVKDEEGSEVAHYGKERGFDYCATARAAAQGEPAAMQQFFSITDTDGGAAESHAGYFNMVIHLLGDQKLAAFLARQPLNRQLDVRNQMGDFTFWPFEGAGYVERNFPQTAKLLCKKEITNWVSPDGRHAVRKVFSEACASSRSKVVRAELIERATGKVIADLTDADIGQGYQREGKVLWSPDSKCFAYFSGAEGQAAQTVVYKAGANKFFARAKPPILSLPGREADPELRSATHLWTFEEPTSWTSSDVLVLLHHEYFEGKRADSSIHSIGRTYEVTWNIATGESVAKPWKLEE